MPTRLTSARHVLLSLALVLFLIGCKPTLDDESSVLFTRVPAEYSGVTFSNDLVYSAQINPFTFHNFYNGGGVAIGDINNDNLPDLFFCGNMQPNKLYLNLGNFKFKDISKEAEISSDGMWYSGVTFVDINADGLLDIYLCRAADFLVGWRGNELLINNGDLTFTDHASEYGLSNAGFSTHAAFFDMDNDRDLDCYLLSNSNRSSYQYNSIKNQREIPVQNGGNKLFRNEGNRFTDVTKESGIYSSVIGFGLGVTISDINRDGWQDIYVSNDFFERDYLYLNNQRGGFTECLEKYVREISLFSMGADIADFNNDGNVDIFVTDMLPENEGRIKSKTSFETWEKYQSNLQKGYYHQFLRNVLQLNRGPLCRNDSCEFYFSEVGRMAQVHATDWSWGALMADLNNDGLKDIFVANGMFKDVTDQDFIQFMANDSLRGQRFDHLKVLELLPSEPLASFVFMNEGDLKFESKSAELGLDERAFSNGAAYGDLDNDGDLDLVTNNINSLASIYRNNTNAVHPENKFLQVRLVGIGQNTFGVGAKVTTFYHGGLSYLEQLPARGFQSCVDQRLTFGLGKTNVVDSLIVEWAGGKIEKLRNIKTNQLLTLNEANANANAKKNDIKPKQKMIFAESDNQGIEFAHREDYFVDFNTDKLTYQMLSTAGPHIARGDVNADGLDDLYIGGAKGQAGEIFAQLPNGRFQRKVQQAFVNDKESEDTDCLFFDADGDDDLDLIVTSGGNIYATGSPYLLNRFYRNGGNGDFVRVVNALPILEESANSSTVSAADFDHDGDIDLFIGGRSIPGKYGAPCDGVILQNDGKGTFQNVTAAVGGELKQIGMITDSEWLDYDGDSWPDLVLAGEYMPLKVFQNNRGKLKDVTSVLKLDSSQGWWNKIIVTDINHDGLPDIVAGNHGLNSRFKASHLKPITLYVGDVDDNGVFEQILCTYNGEVQYPMVLRHDLVSLLPFLKKRFLKYEDYKNKSLDQILTADQLSKLTKSDAYTLASCIFLNTGRGAFEMRDLPTAAQVSPIYAMLADDFDGDGNVDILTGGNFYESKPEVGIYDGSYGVLLKGDGNGNFSEVTYNTSNLLIRGAVRDFAGLKSRGRNIVVTAKNNSSVEVFSWSQNP
jgi:enediyne biosynthesis protein E4